MVLPTTVASLLGDRRHARILNSSRRRSRRSFLRDRLLRLNAAESVEKSGAEFPTAGEIHEEVDGVVAAHENMHRGPEEPLHSFLFRSICRKCPVRVSEHVDVNGYIAHKEHDADDDQHHCR